MFILIVEPSQSLRQFEKMAWSTITPLIFASFPCQRWKHRLTQREAYFQPERPNAAYKSFRDQNTREFAARGFKKTAKLKSHVADVPATRNFMMAVRCRQRNTTKDIAVSPGSELALVSTTYNPPEGSAAMAKRNFRATVSMLSSPPSVTPVAMHSWPPSPKTSDHSPPPNLHCSFVNRLVMTEPAGVLSRIKSSCNGNGSKTTEGSVA